MLCSFSWQLLFHLFLSIPIAYADWNFGPQATDNKPSPPAGFATNNGLPKDLTLDPAMVEDFSARAFDQSQGNTISNGFELSSVQIDGTIPEGLIMAEGGEGCLPNDGRSSRKMRVRRDQGVCEWNTPQQFRNVPQTPNTEQQKKPQGQITGGKKPPGDRKKRKTSVTVVRLTPNKEKEAELWFPKENRPKSDKGRCRMPEYDIPVCAYFADSIEMFPAVMGLGPVCILVPATACRFPLPSLQLNSRPNFFTTHIS